MPSVIKLNPIGRIEVEAGRFYLKIDSDNGIVELKWIDAEKGTPILDIKPYHPCLDRVKDVQLPEWCSLWPRWYEDSATFDWAAVYTF